MARVDGVCSQRSSEQIPGRLVNKMKEAAFSLE